MPNFRSYQTTFADPGSIIEDFDDDPRPFPDGEHTDEFACLDANDCDDDGGHVFLTSCGVTRCIYCRKVVA